MWSLYEIIHICTAVIDESEDWSSQQIFLFKQLERRSLKKIRASTGFEPVTSAIPVRCSTNWAMKPHIGSEVNLFYLAPNVWLHSSVRRASHRYRRGHGFESRWSPDFFFRLFFSNCLNWKIYCDDHSSLSSTTAVQIWIISYNLLMVFK